MVIEIIFNIVIYLMKIFFKLLFVSALVVTTVLALLPIEMLTAPVFNWWDKAQHALAFAVLGALGFAAFPSRPGRVALGLVLYGVAIELAQLAVGWRYGEWEDVVADTAVLALVWLLRRLWLLWRPWPLAVEDRSSMRL